MQDRPLIHLRGDLLSKCTVSPLPLSSTTRNSQYGPSVKDGHWQVSLPTHIPPLAQGLEHAAVKSEPIQKIVFRNNGQA